ncbi:MAG: Flp pilus assembly complex ATPase component TadA [Lachnospiraceae bacterium]|nr:Flp pilus assembly complex ATPase component TadA [Lachnospiraceae bacterium]
MKYEKLIIELMDFFTGSVGEWGEQQQWGKDKEADLEIIKDTLRLRNISESRIGSLALWLWDCLFGQALLNQLFSDPMVSDVKILAHDHIRLKCLGDRKDSALCFENPKQYLHFTEYLLCRFGLQMDDPRTLLSFCDSSSHTGELLCYHVSSRRGNSSMTPYLHIHRIFKKKKYIQDLVDSGMLKPQAASYLMDQVRYGSCILFTGSSRLDLSILMNALIDQIPHSHSALAIQEREELFTTAHPEFMFQYTAPRWNKEETCSSQELLEHGMLMDADYLILDELKPENVLSFWRAVCQGQCCWSTLPSVDAREALDTLAGYLCQETDCALETVLPSLQSISCVVSLAENRVTELLEVQGWDPEARQLRLHSVL